MHRQNTCVSDRSQDFELGYVELQSISKQLDLGLCFSLAFLERYTDVDRVPEMQLKSKVSSVCFALSFVTCAVQRCSETSLAYCSVTCIHLGW